MGVPAFCRTAAASAAAVLLSGCGNASGQGVEPGGWEVTVTRPGPGGVPGVPTTRRHCLSMEAAEQPTLAALADVKSPDASWPRATLADGDISLDTAIDTPDRSVRGMPVRIAGSYGDHRFTFTETIVFLGHDVISTFEGRYVGECR